MRLHEALEKTTTGKVQRQGADWYLSRDDAGGGIVWHHASKTFCIGEGCGWSPRLPSLLADDWEPVPPEVDEWERVAEDAARTWMHPTTGVSKATWIAWCLKAKFGGERCGPKLDYEKLARIVLSKSVTWHDVSEAAEAMRKEVEGTP